MDYYYPLMERNNVMWVWPMYFCFSVTLAENFSTFGEIEAVKVHNLYLPKIITGVGKRLL